MANQRFDAQTLTDTATKASTQTFEMVLVNASGERLTVSFPLPLAASVLVPVLGSLSIGAQRPAGTPEFSKNVSTWQVGRSNEEPKVLLRFGNDQPYAMLAVDAKKFWREVREEADTVSRMAPPTRQ